MSRPAPAWRSKLGDHGHPLGIFHRAIERGNVVTAEATARELGSPSLTDALDLTALVAKKDRVRARRMSVRWLARWLAETESPSLDGAGLVVASLSALGTTSTTTPYGRFETWPPERLGVPALPT